MWQPSPLTPKGFVIKTLLANRLSSSSKYHFIDILNSHEKRNGLAILCVSPGTPGHPSYINNCTAMGKMKTCLKRQLGYTTICVGENNVNVTVHEMASLLAQIRSLTLPKHYTRVIFYYFGHAKEDKLTLADGEFDKGEIIKCLQAISLSENVFKILMFDCCRVMGEDVANSDVGYGQYPDSVNTLVINATQKDCEAFYYVATGCGLMTHYFVELAPKRNFSLADLLNEIRLNIVDIVQEPNSMLVYEHKLMGRCNLLAESQGESKHHLTLMLYFIFSLNIQRESLLLLYVVVRQFYLQTYISSLMLHWNHRLQISQRRFSMVFLLFIQSLCPPMIAWLLLSALNQIPLILPVL